MLSCLGNAATFDSGAASKRPPLGAKAQLLAGNDTLNPLDVVEVTLQACGLALLVALWLRRLFECLKQHETTSCPGLVASKLLATP